MSPLDRMLRGYVTPVLADAGFRNTGRRTYRLVADNGDQAFVNFQRWDTSAEHVAFFVNLSVLSMPYWDWLRYVLPANTDRQPDYSDGLWHNRVDAPPEVAADDGPWSTERWLLASADMVPTCGAHLAQVLREDVVPLLTRLLDRAEFLAMSRDPAKALGVRLGPVEIMLLVDEGPSPELEAEIARCEALDPRDYPVAGKLAAWARVRAAARAWNS